MWIAQLGALGLATPSSAVDTKPLREITREEAAQWKWITSPQLTPDGRWFVYLATPAWNVPQGALATAIIRSTFDETERRYPIGHTSPAGGNLKISLSGRWVAFQTSEVERPGEQPAQLDLTVVDAESGARRVFKAVREFAFVGGERELLLLAGYTKGQGDPSFTLTVNELETDGVRKIDAVNAYAVDTSGAYVAWGGTDGLHALDLRSGRLHQLDHGPTATYDQLTWSSQAKGLAALRHDARGVALVAFTQLDKGIPKKLELLEGAQKTLLQDAELVAPLKWRADERGLYFSIRPKAQPAVSAPVQTVPNLVLWHSRDDRLPGEKKADAGQLPSYWCFVNLVNQRMVRLSDETLSDVAPHERGSYVLGYDMSHYGWQNSLMQGANAPQLRDYYLMSLDTGRRTPLMQGLRFVGREALSIPPQISPDGAVVLYQNNDGDYIAYEIESGISHNLTAGLPTKFYFPENDPKRGHQPKGGDGQGYPTLQGWSDDSSYVLISDYYDVWALPLKDGRAKNLTGNGRSEDVWYTRIVLTEQIGWQVVGAQAPVNLHAPIYFRASDLKTGQTGLARWSPERGGLETLHMEGANVHYYKAKRAEVYLYSRMTSSESEDYYLVDAQWRPTVRLTDINPQQRNYRWPPKAKYLTYKTAHGDTRHAVLYLPIDYVPGKAYPAVVQLYLVMSSIIHEYGAPLHAFPEQYQRRGYAFLLPDITPRIDEAGRAALEDVTAAVEAAAATGIVDKSRLGLLGHSYGAYEAEFIVSQSNIFKAAAPIAGFSQLWSQYGAVYGNRWPYSVFAETSQPFLGGPWWEHWNAYIDNSPLYHARNINTPLLLIHGDQDTAVPFSQSVELFNTLRRLGKPAVLLQYKGVDHEFEGANVDDSNQRVFEFFEHFLKGAVAPKWWSDGVSLYEGQVPSVSSGTPDQ